MKHRGRLKHHFQTALSIAPHIAGFCALCRQWVFCTGFKRQSCACGWLERAGSNRLIRLRCALELQRGVQQQSGLGGAGVVDGSQVWLLKHIGHTVNLVWMAQKKPVDAGGWRRRVKR